MFRAHISLIRGYFDLGWSDQRLISSGTEDGSEVTSGWYLNLGSTLTDSRRYVGAQKRTNGTKKSKARRGDTIFFLIKIWSDYADVQIEENLISGVHVIR